MSSDGRALSLSSAYPLRVSTNTQRTRSKSQRGEQPPPPLTNAPTRLRRPPPSIQYFVQSELDSPPSPHLRIHSVMHAHHSEPVSPRSVNLVVSNAPQFHTRDSPYHWLAAETPNDKSGLVSQPRSVSRRPPPSALSHVEFHHRTAMGDTYVGSSSEISTVHVSTLSRASESSQASHSSKSPSSSTTLNTYPSSLPTSLQWPLHPQHSLVYAGTSSGNSVHICTCRNCRSEHYSTAVYSCLEHGCNYHICIQCALEQITAARELERQQQILRCQMRANERVREQEEEMKYNGSVLADITAQGEQQYNLSVLEKRNSIEPGSNVSGATHIDLTKRLVNQTPAPLLAAQSSASQQFVRALASSAAKVGVPLVLLDQHHSHPLVYFPVTPFDGNDGSGSELLSLHRSIEDTKLLSQFTNPLLSAHAQSQSLSLPRWYCNLHTSRHCVTHHNVSRSFSTPSYVCYHPHCQHRVCLSCVRHTMTHTVVTNNATSSVVGTMLASSLSNSEKVELSNTINVSRSVESHSTLYQELCPTAESLAHTQSLLNYLIGFAAFFATLMFHALLLAFSTINHDTQQQWINVIIVLIFCVVSGIAGKSVTRYTALQQSKLRAALTTLHSLYHTTEWEQILHTGLGEDDTVDIGPAVKLNVSEIAGVTESGESSEEGVANYNVSQPPSRKPSISKPTTTSNIGKVFSLDSQWFRPRHKHVLLSVYYQHGRIQSIQRLVPLLSLLRVLLLIASEALLAAAVTIVFVIVWCRIPVGVTIGDCSTRLGVPVGVGLFSSLALLHLGQIINFTFAFMQRYSLFIH